MPAPSLLLTRAEHALAQGDLREAGHLFRLALDRDPKDARAMAGMGRVLLTSQQPQTALPILRAALGIDPDNPGARADLAVTLAQLGNHAVALEVAQTLPETPGMLVFRAERLEALERRAEALALLNTALARHPEDPGLHRTRALLARRAERWEEAEASLSLLAARFPEDPAIHSSLGNTLAALGRDALAEDHLRRATALAPDRADWWYNLAHHLIARDRLEEARPLAERAAELAPDRPYCHTNLGICLLGLGHLEAALAAHHRALALDPDEPEARYDLAWAQLTAGHWAEGWANHEARWRMPRFTGRRAPPAGRPWDGGPLAPGETLLLHAEQGLGDALMMARLVPLAAARAKGAAESGVTVTLECHAPLVRLFQGVDGPDRVVPRSDPPPVTEVEAPLMSLPHLLGVTSPEAVPGAAPWLTPPPPTAAPSGARPRVGLVWRGAVDNRMDPLRSCPESALAPLLALDPIDWVSLQLGAPPLAPTMADGLEGVTDMADTAAVLAGLDLVIGVDTSVIHLAGAMGLNCWVLLAFVPDYRWMLEREDSPWYPSLRLFRQEARGDWPGLVARVAAALGERFPPSQTAGGAR